MSAYDVADLDLDEYDEPTLDDAADELTADDHDAALEWLHGPRNPLAGYPTPVTRPCKPDATGRAVDDVLPTL
ncbi:hypothetical protein ACGFXB_25040 [Streptomyces canus]|uniref:hypothetical protein n=1 Tax=Streptomyces canus TaxID=58343 RepID=UPI00371AA932